MGQREALLNVNSLDRRTKEWSQDDETKKQRERAWTSKRQRYSLKYLAKGFVLTQYKTKPLICV